MTAKGVNLVIDNLLAHGLKYHGMGNCNPGACSLKTIWASS